MVSQTEPLRAEIESRVAEVAARQHGVVTRDQLLTAGLPVHGIRSRLRAGRLLRLQREIYLVGALVGPLRPRLCAEMAAVLACGREAAVSHRSALWVHGILPVRPLGPVHVVLESGRCRRPGILAHRVARLSGGDVTTVHGIPTTVVVRTILDVAADASPREIERVMARAERLLDLDVSTLRERVERERRRPGAPLLRAMLVSDAAPAFTRSVAEDRFLELVRMAGLPEPEANVRLTGRELDFLWRDHGVAVEVDGFSYHRSRRSFESDRSRDFDLAGQGIQVLRVTWRQIVNHPFMMVRRLAATLTRAEVRGDPSQPV